MAELLFWTALDCTGVPNELAIECMLLTIKLCMDKPCPSLMLSEFRLILDSENFSLQQLQPTLIKTAFC